MKTLVFLTSLCAGAVHADDFRITQPVVLTNTIATGTFSLVSAPQDYHIYGKGVTLHCELEPVVKKEGDGWVITFKPKAEGK